ncbi:hydroxylysine kinase [Harmonia axyridis]|uniref:hydroxylysine kinase n=1 Tax=Harmonia axyridis TaxID=115357 RepID=UPI001E279902|nr:hydroxylysine kinase [Harmonia axyridis]
MNKNKAETIVSAENIKAIVSPKDVETILFDLYGLEVIEIKDLNGYDDKNFMIQIKNSKENDALCDNRYVFKVINSLDSKDINFFRAQDSALLYLADRGVCCPIPIENKNGEYLALKQLSSDAHIVRLLKFIPGIILAQTEINPVLCYECGTIVATIHVKLRNFSHEGYKDRNTPWMLANVPQLQNYIFAVKDDSRKKLVTDIIAAFTSEVLPKSEKLEKGLIHGDVNEQNVLVEQQNGRWHVKGILDFGDSHEACLLFDVAITMTYMIIEAENIDYGGYVLTGYNSVKRLLPEEMNLLKICVCARFCQSLVMGAFTITRDPENTYVIRTAKAGWTILEELWNIPNEEILGRWLKIGENFESASYY